MSSFIKLDNVIFSYGDNINTENKVLKGINLEIQKGEFISLLGNNGCGKSTLAKHLNAILLPNSGNVFIDGINTINEDMTYEIRKKVGLILQNPDNQIIASTVEEDVAFGPENLGMSPGKIRERVDYALKTVGMYEYCDHTVCKLSGGQKQRIAIAGILAMGPDCIVLDEPTSMLDPIGKGEVLSTIKKLNTDNGITIVLITHFMEEAALSDRIVIMNDGKISIEGTPKDIFSKIELLRKYGLDIPQATELAERLRLSGYDVPSGVVNNEECIVALERLLVTL